ncbi:MAG: hypothetical protein ACRDSR_20495 [Pseudonocardiaceae bacterium]
MTFLILGIALVLADGQLILRSGRRYLQGAHEPGAGRSMLQMVAALFHFGLLGLLALISLIDVDTGLPVRDVVVKLGVLLLVLAAAHGVTILILMRIRDRRQAEELAGEFAETPAHSRVPQSRVPGAAVSPVTDTGNGHHQSLGTEPRW